jgi:hypothetical protein
MHLWLAESFPIATIAARCRGFYSTIPTVANTSINREAESCSECGELNDTTRQFITAGL